MAKADRLLSQFGTNIQESMTDFDPSDREVIRMQPATTKLDGAERLKGAMVIPVGKIQPDPSQPRKHISAVELDELAASIKEVGLLQPIRVRWDEVGGRWLIVNGERRYRAHLALGLPTIATIEEISSEAGDVLVRQLIENMQRADLSPTERAAGIRQLIAHTGWTQDRAAQYLGLSKGHVSKLLAIGDLPEDERNEVSSRNISMTEAYERAITPAREGRPASQRTTPKRISYDVSGGRITIMVKEGEITPRMLEKMLKEALILIKREGST